MPCDLEGLISACIMYLLDLSYDTETLRAIAEGTFMPFDFALRSGDELVELALERAAEHVLAVVDAARAAAGR